MVRIGTECALLRVGREKHNTSNYLFILNVRSVPCGATGDI